MTTHVRKAWPRIQQAEAANPRNTSTRHRPAHVVADVRRSSPRKEETHDHIRRGTNPRRDSQQLQLAVAPP